MKRKLLFTVLLAGFSIGGLFAQEKDSVITMPTLKITSGTVVTKEVDQAFQKAFPNAANLEWYKLNKDYMAQFIQNDMKHRALFKKNGYLKYNISYGYEKDLPNYIKVKINETYKKYKVINVANVKHEDRDIWVINLDGPKNLLMVRMEGDEMDELTNYKKAK